MKLKRKLKNTLINYSNKKFKFQILLNILIYNMKSSNSIDLDSDNYDSKDGWCEVE